MLFIFEEVSKAFACKYYANNASLFIQYIDFLFNKMLQRGFNLQQWKIKRWQTILNDGQIF